MKIVNYIIPVSNTAGPDFDQRLKSLQYGLDNFVSKQSGVKVNAIIVEQIVDPLLPSFIGCLNIPRHTVRFTSKTIKVKYPVFVKPWLYNVGINAAESNHLILAESDLYSGSFFKDLLKYVEEKDLKWCFIWDRLQKLTKSGTENLFATDEIDSEGSTVLSPQPGLCEGMGVYFRKDFFLEEIHWSNEMFQKLGCNDNELAYRAQKASETYSSYPTTMTHMWHSTSHMKSGAVHNLNDDLKAYIKEGDNYKRVNSFLALKKLGDIHNPLHVTEQLIERFSNLGGEDTAMNNILVADPWTESSSYSLQEWLSYLKKLIARGTYKKVALGCLVSHLDDYKKIKHSDIKLIPFNPDAELFKINSLVIRNYDRLGYVEYVNPPVKEEAPTKESIIYSVVKKNKRIKIEDPFGDIINKMESDEILEVDVVLEEPEKVEEEKVITQEEIDQVKSLLEDPDVPKPRIKVKKKIEGHGVPYKHEPPEKILKDNFINIDEVKRQLEDPEAVIQVKPDPEKKEEVEEKATTDVETLKKMLEDPEVSMKSKAAVVKAIKKSVSAQEIQQKRNELLDPEEDVRVSSPSTGYTIREYKEVSKAPAAKPKAKIYASWKERKKELIESRVYGDVSVVIPCHNNNNYILEHISEIIYNEFKEIIIVDWDSDEYLGKTINSYFSKNKDPNIVFKKYHTTEFFNAGLPSSVKPIPVLDIIGHTLDSNVKIVPIKNKGSFDAERSLNIGSRACEGLNIFYYIPGKDKPNLCDAYEQRIHEANNFDPKYKPPFASKTSLVTTCMNRADFLLYSLPTWIGRGFKEIVIVDWSSEIPVIGLLEPFSKYKDETIKVVRVDGMDHFNAGKARNTGTKEATGDYILYTDSDMRQVSLECVDQIDDCVYHGINKMAPFGTCFMSRKVLDAINGYTELMPGYGWEDNDLYDRIEEAGFKRYYFQYGFAKHIDHDDAMRIKHRGQEGKSLFESLQEYTFQRDNWRQWGPEDKQDPVSFFPYTVKEYYGGKVRPKMKRNLLYYIYPVECPMLHFNLRLLSKYSDVFDRKLICLGLDKKTLRADEVEELFRRYGIKDYELMPRDNVPSLGDGAYLMEMMSLIRTKDPNEITFFAHAKGVSPGRRDKMWEESVWVELMYRLNLSDMRDIESRLKSFPCVGTFKVKDHRHQVPAPWYYAGTFYWFNHEKIFSRDDWFVPGKKDKWRSEAYLGVRFPEDKVSCIQNREGSLLYHRSTYDSIVEPCYPRNFYLSVTVGRDLTLLRKFMQYYSSLGIHKFLVTVHHNDPDFVREANHILHDYATKVSHTWSGVFTEERKVFHERQLIEKTCAGEDWVIYADMDEFHEYPDHLPYFLEECTETGVNYVEGRIIDRLTNNGSLPVINPGASLEKTFPIKCNYSKSVLSVPDKKIAAAQAKIPVGLCNRDIGPCDIELKKHSWVVPVHHFKWDNRILRKMKKSYENKEKDPNNRDWYDQTDSFLHNIRRNNYLSMDGVAHLSAGEIKA